MSQRPWIAGLPTRFRIGERLGAGSTSEVWRARDLVSGVDVVVKVIDDEGAAARLEREARALARLRGVAGVVRVHELGRSPDGTAWMVCDLAAGGSLRDRIDGAPGSDGSVAAEGARGVLNPAEAWTVTHQLATALAAAHERRVVHGDVSPANVLFDDAGNAMLADFGAADLDGRADPVRQGFTPAFAAPERRRGAAASTAGDVYSLATTVLAATVTAATVPSDDEPLGHGPDGEPPDERLVELLARCRDEHPGRRPTADEIAAGTAPATVRGPARPSGWAVGRRSRRR